MKFVLCLIFIACFVIDDDIFGTNVKQAVGAVEVSALIDLNSHNGDNPHHIEMCSAIIGGDCGKDALCCVGICDSTTHKCACVPNSGVCECNKDCCNGNCRKGHCACRAKGDKCRVSTDCCVGICRNRRCGTCVADSPETCKRDSDCCKGKCDANNKQCICELAYGQCTSDHDCCGGTCGRTSDGVSRVCRCASINYTCDPLMPDPCCFGTCEPSGTPRGYECIASPQNAVCDVSVDCDSLVCKKNRCSCNVVGETCAFDRKCCQGLNCDETTLQCQK